MLQQTQVATVIDYFNRFIRRFPDISALAAADREQVLKLWEGLGYYSRARHLHEAVKKLVADGHARVPGTPGDFIRLSGVGEYTNAAVQSIAFGHPLAVVDGNVKRVLARLLLMNEPVNKAGAHKVYQEVATDFLDHNDPGTFNQAMMELGAMVCKPANPFCPSCPVSQFCEARKNNQVSDFPKRIKTKKVPTHHLVAGVICKRDLMLIVRRPEQGMLGGLWELPAGPVKKGVPLEESCRITISETVNLKVSVDRHLIQVRHAYTHFKIKMDVYLCQYQAGRVRLSGPVAHDWVRRRRLTVYPFHKAMHKVFPALEDAR